MVAAVLYTRLAVVAVNRLIGSAGGSGSEDTKGWTAWLISFPFVIGLVGSVGVLITGFGVAALFWKNVTAAATGPSKS
jgi:hypothetical protein